MVVNKIFNPRPNIRPNRCDAPGLVGKIDITTDLGSVVESSMSRPLANHHDFEYTGRQLSVLLEQSNHMIEGEGAAILRPVNDAEDWTRTGPFKERKEKVSQYLETENFLFLNGVTDGRNPAEQ
jgi:hypothetical protein